MSNEIAPIETNQLQAGRWLTLVPVEVFGLLCEDHDDLPRPVAWGLSDAVSARSDCNRAEGHIYRVDDLTGPREPGESARVWVADVDLPFFDKHWGDPNTGVDPVERFVSMDPPTAVRAALSAPSEPVPDKPRVWAHPTIPDDVKAITDHVGRRWAREKYGRYSWVLPPLGFRATTSELISTYAPIVEVVDPDGD